MMMSGWLVLTDRWVSLQYGDYSGLQWCVKQWGSVERWRTACHQAIHGSEWWLSIEWGGATRMREIRDTALRRSHRVWAGCAPTPWGRTDARRRVARTSPVVTGGAEWVSHPAIHGSEGCPSQEGWKLQHEQITIADQKFTCGILGMPSE